MLKLFPSVLCLFLLFIGFTTNAQNLEEWNWSSKNVTFVSIDDMNVTTNENAQFEAYNSNVYMYLEYKSWNSNQEELVYSLLDIAHVVNIDNERKVKELNNNGLKGYYLFGEVQDEKLMVFNLGNKESDVVVYGVIKYEDGWEKTALEMARSIVISE